MSIGYRVWVFSLLGAAALLAPACGDDDSASNNNEPGGAAGTGTAGDRNMAGHPNIGGAGSGGDAGNGGGGAGGGGAAAATCGKLDLASGVVTCGEVKYRERVGTGCFWSPPDKAPEGGAGGGAGTSGGAGQSLGGSDATDSGCSPDNCTEKPRGYCEAEAPGASGAGPVTCHYGCLVDNDCGANEICVCSGDPSYGGRCVQVFCKTDADCTNGNRCGSSTGCDQFSCNDDPVCAIH